MACGVLVSQLGIEPTLPTLKCKVLTKGPPGESHLSPKCFILVWKHGLRCEINVVEETSRKLLTE